jgi:hypothetical protein
MARMRRLTIRSMILLGMLLPMLLLALAQPASRAAAIQGDPATWTASVQVSLCDAPPGSGNEMSCQAGPGVTVTISLASGERLGSCTTGDPQPTPRDTFISTCSVEGMPFNADLVATQDPATIPAGFAPWQESLSIHVDDLIPGGGDQATFTFIDVPAPAGTVEPAVTPASGTLDLLSLLPSGADVPGGLVETGRGTRSLPEVVANYTDPAETTRLFTAWGWQGNALASFALPAGQQAQRGQVNGVYVSIHQFGGADEARAALDFSLTEQAAGTELQEVSIRPLGESTRALYGPTDYGNETTVLTQQGGLLIRVSAAMLDGDPTADAVAVSQAILRKAESASTTEVSTGPASSGPPIEYFYVGCIPAKACLNATITLTTEDGQFIASGTCPDTDMIAPWTCGPRNVPRGIPVVITIDGIAPGWVAEQNPLYWDTTKEPSPAPSEWPGGMPIFNFVQTHGSASSGTGGSVITADSGGSGEATLLVTFRGCPEEFDPATGDFFAECTIPLDAPEAAFIYWGVKLENDPGGMHITDLERRDNGAYVFQAGPGRLDLNISHLSPVVRDAYRVIGADNDVGIDHLVYLAGGETREVYVFYYYE